MNEDIKKEISDILNRQPRKRLERWIRISIVFILMLIGTIFTTYLSKENKSNGKLDFVIERQNKVINLVEKLIYSDAENKSNISILKENITKADMERVQLKSEIYDIKEINKEILKLQPDIIEAIKQSNEISNLLKPGLPIEGYIQPKQSKIENIYTNYDDITKQIIINKEQDNSKKTLN